MNGFDIALLVLACVLVVFGMIKGLVRILIGVAALIAAFALAAHYHQPLASFLGGVEAGGPLRLVSYVLIFIAVMLAGAVIGHFSRKLLKVAMLSWADRVAGAALGLAAAALAAALLILPVVAYSPHSERVLSRSVLAPYVSVVADVANLLVPAELSEEYRRRIEFLRQTWDDRFDQAPGKGSQV